MPIIFTACFKIFWPRCTARRISVPQPGIEPMPPAVGVQSLHHWTPGKCLPSHNCIKEELGFPGSSVVENPPTKAGDARDTHSSPGSGRSPREGNGNPLQCSCLESPMDRRAWWAAIYRVAQSRTRLK